MEIQSSSSTPMIWKYDVFVSFRGEDTRYNFTDHLFGALHGKGFVTFRDDTMLRKGENISTELIQAIEGSQILIVVFSKNYASSTWCLQELAKIADCIEGKRQTVLPVLCDVRPSEVRKQSDNYREAFLKHEERFKENFQMVQRWRGALAQVADLSGWDVTNKPQHALIGEVIKRVTNLLSHKFSILPNDIVGIQSPLKELEKLLVLDSNDGVRVLGICGMGALGKSTLATFLYQRISSQFDFDGTCFIDDISKLFREHGPMEAQKQILSQTLNEENLHVSNLPMTTNLMQTRLRHKKALIILDNVDEVKQLDKLAMKREFLGAGSRIIIISRDEHILREYVVDEVYKVQLLNNQDALQLFCRKAFKRDDVMRDYIDLTNEVLKYVGGLPLAINVLGSFLFGRSVSEWKSALVRLKENPKKDIMDVLRISFDALEDTEKEIFLDTSCFFDGRLSNYEKNILDIRGLDPDIGIPVLIEKSLLVVDGYKHFKMHDLLKELGKNIVREKSPKEPWKWSRLWDIEDFHNVMLVNKPLYNLRRMDLSHSRNLIKIPDFWEAQNLESLILEGCIKLVRINQPIDTLRKLVDLNFQDCKNLVSTPNCIFHLSSLLDLNLSGCSKLLRNNLFEKPRDTEHLKKLEINESSIQRQSSSSLYKFLKFPIHFMYSRRHDDSVRSLLPYLPRFPCLQSLNLSFCNLLQIPDAIGLFQSRRQGLTRVSLAGLYIFDCPKLCMTKNFYSIAFSWMIQLVKMHMKSSFSWDYGGIQIVIPGAEIPRWFSGQNVGNSIHMDSSPIMRSQNWIGATCCVTFVMHDDPTNLRNPKYNFTISCSFHHKPSGLIFGLSGCLIPIILRKDLVTVEFDHMVLLYFPRVQLSDYKQMFLEGVEFVSTILEQPLGLHVEVKMCGYLRKIWIN